jgi:hypothetical protein
VSIGQQDLSLLDKIAAQQKTETYTAISAKRLNSHILREERRQALQHYKDTIAQASRRVKSLSLQCKALTEKRLQDLHSERIKQAKLQRSHRCVKSDVVQHHDEFLGPDTELTQMKISIRTKSRCNYSLTKTSQTEDP